MKALNEHAPRNYNLISREDVINEIEFIDEICTATKTKFSEVVKVMQLLEIRRKNDLYVANGDTFDEQIAAVGSLIEQLTSAVYEIKE